jgi:trafficking protein particle complex subunit 13
MAEAPYQVSNPLAVKTKVHAPKSLSALLSATEREKIFLEVHVQNLTQEAMWFEHILFECVDGWQVVDVNFDDKEEESIFSGSMAMMQPQDMRQYIYILSPTSTPSFPVVHAPGSVIPLGRLDISWRSTFGEPGRLLTSVSFPLSSFRKHY